MTNPHQEVFNEDLQEMTGQAGSEPTKASKLEVESKPSVSASAAGAASKKDSGSSDQESAPIDAYFASFDEKQVDLENIIGTDDRTRINPTTSYPWRAICALRIRSKTGKNFVGTGWLISARTVITAGHCVYMHNEGGWAESIEVIPAMNGSLKPYGSGLAATFRTSSGWANDRNRDYDYGAIILKSDYRPGDIVGSFGFATRNDNDIKNFTLNLSGYPADKGAAEQWFMARKPSAVSDSVITYQIDTFGGQSGSPVWFLQSNNRYAIGIHTNGHNSGNSATRIVSDVYNNLTTWKNLGL